MLSCFIPWHCDVDVDVLHNMASDAQKVVKLVKQNPAGIPLNKLAVFFSQKYKKNLTASKHGYRNITEYINSLEELVTVDQVVFHRSEVPGAVSAVPQCLEQPRKRRGASNHCSTEDLRDAAVLQLTGPPLQLPPPVDPEFPALGAKLSRAEERRPRGAAGGRGPVFRESYHAQLREWHNSNTRAAETLENDEETGSQRSRRKVVSVEEVNSLAQDVIRSLATSGDLVTVEKVISQVCALLQVPSLKAFRITHRDLPAVENLQRSIKEVNVFIECVDTVSTMCTLHELALALAGLKNKKRFEELSLGPLCKFPIIHRLFKVDPNTKDEDIHQIETVDILRSLREFRKKQTKQMVDLAEFMQFLADQHNCESPYELGIRIQSVALAISTLKKVTNEMYDNMDHAKNILQKDVEEEVQAQLWKIKKKLMDPAQGPPIFSPCGSTELRFKYANMSAADAVIEVLTNSEGMLNTKMTKRVQDFLNHVAKDRPTRSLFQMAICCGSLEPSRDLNPKEKPQKSASEKKHEESAAANVVPPSVAAVEQYLLKCVSTVNGPLTLASLSKLEKKVTEHFSFRDFNQLGQNTFLDFLVKQTLILQQVAGGSIMLNCPDSRPCGFRPSKQDVFEFIRQCGEENSSKLDFTECALRNHFAVGDSKDLGYGPLKTLVELVQRQRQLGDPVGPCLLHYEAPLLPAHSGHEVSELVGRLGEVSREQAVFSLLSTPLLEDLGSWSLWELVFQPSHGSLKDFIHSHCGHTDLLALEVAPGVILRATSCTSDSLFSEAAQILDPIGTAGHLVSIVMSHGVQNAPIPLLANHMKSSLAAAVAQQVSPNAVYFPAICGESEEKSYGRIASFILECIFRIPTRICKALLQQVFLEPLSKVVGQSMSRKVLLNMAGTRYLNKLHQMGVLLGITEWTQSFQTNLRSPETPFTKHLNSLARRTFEHRVCESGDTSEEEVQISSSTSSREEEDVGDGHEKGLFETSSDESEELSDSPITLDTNTTVLTGELDKVGDATEEQCESREHSHKAVVDDIRKSEFGIGVELNEEGQNLMKVHQDRLGRSLERLSTELYSKDTHFVLELIQNADDNSYSEDGAQPSLAFVIEKDCVTILNNEHGFEEKNIRAICDVGRSTKGKHKYGYIGQKGIGFKSVFKVTDRPEIHSSGYHICFDKTSGPMGYILPHWVDEERPLTAEATEIVEQRWTTKILLPLRPENQQTRNLFRDVHPSLLLFLHRLRSITIFNQVEKRVVSMTRKDLSDNILEVHHTDGVQRWLVVKSILYPKMIKADVESTELALAFCLSESVDSSSWLQPQQQNVFAFLPLRSFGFRFIIQGDFDIPSSREDVDRDSSWNQWLRSNLPQLFMNALDIFSSHPEFSGLKGLCYFLQFVPLPDEIQDFFKPVASQILQLLRGRPCLPAKEDKDGTVTLKQASQLAVCQDPLILDVIGTEELNRHLSLSYLHPTLQSHLSQSLLSTLGVHRLTAAEVVMVTRSMVKELIPNGTPLTDSQMVQLARLLLCNFRAEELQYNLNDDTLQELRGIPMIPLADGRLVALSGGGVFFPISESGDTPAGLNALYRDLSCVAPRLLKCLDELGNSQVRELLRRLQVHELEPQQVLQEHVMPMLRSGAWKTKPDDVVISCLLFIKQHGQQQDFQNMSIPVLTDQGFVCPSESPVHFSKEYGNVDLPNVLPGVDWVLLHPCYLLADGDTDGWRKLLGALGVHSLLTVRKETRSLTVKELSSSLWAAESQFWPKPADGNVVIEDYCCEEFRVLATTDRLSAQSLLQQRRKLLVLLAENWHSGEKYSQFKSAQVRDGDGHFLRETLSSFQLHLRQLPWVPTFRVQHKGVEATGFKCPGTTYLYSEQLHSLLGAHVDYIDTNITPSEFLSDVGVRHMVTVDMVVDLVKKWSADGGEAGSFCSTVQHIHSVYSYLLRNCSSVQLWDLFRHTPAVFVEHERMNDDWCSGKFYHLKDVCWAEPTRMFQRYKELLRTLNSGLQEPRILATFYSVSPEIKELFLRQLKVEPDPSMKQYVDLLELICDSDPQASSAVLQDVSVIYAKLADKCRVHGEDLSVTCNPAFSASLKSMVSGKRVFPTKHNGWVTLERRPLIPDNKSYEKIFQTCRDLCLLNLPPAQTNQGRNPSQGKAFREEDRGLFLEICGLKKLSQCITTEAQTVSYRPCPALQALVREVIPYIQSFLFHQEEFAELYSDLLESNIGQKIKTLTFGQVGELYLHYTLTLPDGVEIFQREDIICLLKDKRELYIQKDHLNTKLELCGELVKLFSPEGSLRKDLEHFLEGLLVSTQDECALKRYLNKKGIKDLPDEEERWEVPMPLLPKPELTVQTTVHSAHQGEDQEVGRRVEQDGHETLQCWPPKSSLHQSGGSSHTAKAVDAVVKMWPPPVDPNYVPEKSYSSNSNSHRQLSSPQVEEEMPAPTQVDFAASHNPPQCTGKAVGNSAEPPHQEQRGGCEDQEERRQSTQHPVEPEKQQTASSEPTHQSPKPDAPVVVCSQFQGEGCGYRPLRALDNAVWTHPQTGEFLEDLDLKCSLPQNVAFTEDHTDAVRIGEWGEQLVHSFLCHWKEDGSPGPTDVTWYNQNGESGKPFDFKVTFNEPHSPGSNEIFVEVKTTVKQDRKFIHLSANELDFALKVRDKYHLYRVYGAGDSQNVRLCRIKNLAQQLHSKTVEMFLLV
ncbi:uncharacterized protein LOC114796163 isoform X2 [Denticeps clupeoides]|uniref:uncharacterized protein LOC114796163 isoform X2 n=1 Tax=Denticeps clupeoides TaxID=299321 RepID=UPI0010A3B260|nr:uncharacterized protein LOC114796163 isoform X2 [Denticeps clupeoides]